jgi:hypothetical protein
LSTGVVALITIEGGDTNIRECDDKNVGVDVGVGIRVRRRVLVGVQVTVGVAVDVRVGSIGVSEYVDDEVYGYRGVIVKAAVWVGASVEV